MTKIEAENFVEKNKHFVGKLVFQYDFSEPILILDIEIIEDKFSFPFTCVKFGILSKDELTSLAFYSDNPSRFFEEI
jgi:hypothetical protein